MALFRKLRKRFHRDSTANMHPSRREAEHVRIPRMEAILRKNPTAVHVKYIGYTLIATPTLSLVRAREVVEKVVKDGVKHNKRKVTLTFAENTIYVSDMWYRCGLAQFPLGEVGMVFCHPHKSRVFGLAVKDVETSGYRLYVYKGSIHGYKCKNTELKEKFDKVYEKYQEQQHDDHPHHTQIYICEEYSADELVPYYEKLANTRPKLNPEPILNRSLYTMPEPRFIPRSESTTISDPDLKSNDPTDCICPNGGRRARRNAIHGRRARGGPASDWKLINCKFHTKLIRPPRKIRRPVLKQLLEWAPSVLEEPTTTESLPDSTCLCVEPQYSPLSSALSTTSTTSCVTVVVEHLDTLPSAQTPSISTSCSSPNLSPTTPSSALTPSPTTTPPTISLFSSASTLTTATTSPPTVSFSASAPTLTTATTSPPTVSFSASAPTLTTVTTSPPTVSFSSSAPTLTSATTPPPTVSFSGCVPTLTTATTPPTVSSAPTLTTPSPTVSSAPTLTTVTTPPPTVSSAPTLTSATTPSPTVSSASTLTTTPPYTTLCSSAPTLTNPTTPLSISLSSSAPTLTTPTSPPPFISFSSSAPILTTPTSAPPSLSSSAHIPTTPTSSPPSLSSSVTILTTPTSPPPSISLSSSAPILTTSTSAPPSLASSSPPPSISLSSSVPTLTTVTTPPPSISLSSSAPTLSYVTPCAACTSTTSLATVIYTPEENQPQLHQRRRSPRRRIVSEYIRNIIQQLEATQGPHRRHVHPDIQAIVDILESR